MVVISCRKCGKEFNNYPSNDRKFCSHKCYWASKDQYVPYWQGKKRPEVMQKLQEGKLKMLKERGHPKLGYRKRTIEETKALKAKWASQRRAVKRGNGGFHSLEEWERLKAQYDWTCPRCKRSEPQILLTVDHIVPVSMGGSNNIENIQPLCARCNSVKGNRNSTKYDL